MLVNLFAVFARSFLCLFCLSGSPVVCFVCLCCSFCLLLSLCDCLFDLLVCVFVLFVS